MKRIFLLICLCIILLLAACSGQTTSTQTLPTEAQGQYPSPQETDGYPAPLNYSNVSPYPYPYTTPVVPIVPKPTYTTDPLMGSVVGSLLENNKGIGNVTLFLAEVLKDKTGRDIVAGLDPMKAPTADTSSEGKFAFINVKPGTYALILDVVTTQYMINYPSENNPIIFEVKAGGQVDLGDLNYDSLPLP
jgi:hypothetical protein